MIALFLIGATLSTAAPTSGSTVSAMFAAFNRHDPTAMAALYATDAELTSSDFCKPRSGRDVERTYAALFAMFPDLHDTVDTMIEDGERVAVRFTATSASKDFSVKIVTFLRVRRGKIIEDASVFDSGGRPCSP